ncbi:MAG: RNA 2',3'-cyclic phosphodiesterase, partial [Thermodesulfovibrionaceae bacterium]
MRCFIAIDLPDRIKEFIGGLIKFSTSLEGINIVQPKNYHITIKFLGEIFENFLLELKVLLRSIAKEFSPFELFITAPGVFPDQRNPRVVWIGTDNSSDLKRLVKRVDDELKKFGFDSQQRDFKSHI